MLVESPLFTPVTTALRSPRHCSSSSVLLIRSVRCTDLLISRSHSVRISSSLREIISANSFIVGLQIGASAEFYFLSESRGLPCCYSYDTNLVSRGGIGHSPKIRQL